MYKIGSAFHWVSPMDQIQKQHGCDWPAKTKVLICFFCWERKIENSRYTADFKEKIQLCSFSTRIDLDGMCAHYTIIKMSVMWKELLRVTITWFCSSTHLLICFYCLIWSCCSCWQFFQQQAAVFGGKGSVNPTLHCLPSNKWQTKLAICNCSTLLLDISKELVETKTKETKGGHIASNQC